MRVRRDDFEGRKVGPVARGIAGEEAISRHGRMGGKMGASATPLTRQAFVDRALTMFDRADADKNGTVSQAERKAVRDTMRQQWQAQRAARQQG